MLNIKKKYKINMEKIKNKLRRNTDVVRFIRRSKWGWAGHIFRLRDDRWAYAATVWQPSDEKRKRERQGTRWKDNIN